MSTRHTRHIGNEGPPMVLHTRVMAGTGGGPEKTILRSPRHVPGDRYAMAAAYLHPRGDAGIESVRTQAQQLGCPLHTFGESGAWDITPLPLLLKLCRQRNVRIWHGHDYKSNLYGLVLNRFHPMKLVTTAHLWTNDTLRMRLYRRVDERCLPHYDQVIAVSSALGDRCRQIGVAHDKLHVIHNGIELDDWTRRRSPQQARAALGLPANAMILGVTGRLNVQKRFDRLLHAIKPIAHALPAPLKLLLVGDGPERDNLQRLASQLGLADVVRFCGWQTELALWYEAMDLFVLSSRDEGLPNSVLEAMAMGVPVAATDVGGVRDLLDDFHCGVLLDRDVSQWPTVLSDLLRNESRRRALARQGRAQIQSHFTFEARMAKVMAVYDRVLGITAPHAARAAA